LAVSLARFPGQFWLVRRDLERRVEKQILPMSLRYRQRKAIFSANEATSPLSTLSLAECTVIRCANPAAAETLIDRLETKPDLSSDRRPRALAMLPLSGFQGWAGTWQEIPLKSFFPADSAASRDWQSLMESLSAQFPALTRTRDLHFDGTFHDRRHAEMEVTLQADTIGAAALPAKLNEWLAGRKITGYAQVGASSDSIELVKFEVHFAED
jgi:hypothetical protein